MSYREADIKHETATHWVLDDRKGKCYTVFAIGTTYSTSDSAYPRTADGLELATARCNYLTKRAGLRLTNWGRGSCAQERLQGCAPAGLTHGVQS